MTISLRLATLEDYNEIRSLLLVALAPLGERMGTTRPSDVFCDVSEKIEKRDVYILEEGGKLLAAAVLEEKEDMLYVTYLAVQPALHGQGHGRRLLRDIEMIAESRELYAIGLHTPEVMTELLDYYTKAGFVEIRRAPPAHGRDQNLRVHFRKEMARHGIVADMDHEHDRVVEDVVKTPLSA